MRAIFSAIRTAIAAAIRLAWAILTCWIPGRSMQAPDTSADAEIEQALDDVRAQAAETPHPAETLYGMSGLGQRIVDYCRSHDRDLVDLSGIEPHVIAALVSLDDSQRQRLADAGPKRALQWSLDEPTGLVGLPRVRRRQVLSDRPERRRIAPLARPEPAPSYALAYA